MKREYDFSRGTRGPVGATCGKTRVTVYLENVIVMHLKAISEKTGQDYQTLINEALAKSVGGLEPTMQPTGKRSVGHDVVARCRSESHPLYLERSRK